MDTLENVHLKRTLWQSNIAIGNGPFMVDLPLKMVIFHSYVSLPEDNIATCSSKKQAYKTAHVCRSITRFASRTGDTRGKSMTNVPRLWI